MIGNKLDVIALLILGFVLGWGIRTHTTMDNYLMAKTLKYETETSYYLNKYEQIQLNQKENTNAKR